jgi:hypothetical protein
MGRRPTLQNVVTIEINDLEQLQRDRASEDMQGLLSELHRFACITQLMTERFA